MKTGLIILVILAALTVPAVCLATPPTPGAYMSGFIGVAVPKDSTVQSEDFITGRSFTDRVEFDPGINAGLTGGYDFGYLRLEGEFTYKHGSIKAITDQADNYRFRAVDGDVGAMAMMVNGFLDLHNSSAFTPYLGGGAGFATLYLSDTNVTDTRGSVPVHLLLYENDYDSVLAYQLGGGMEIALNSMLSLDLGYRYFGTTKGKFANNWDQSTEFKFESHNVAIGLRLKF